MVDAASYLGQFSLAVDAGFIQDEDHHAFAVRQEAGEQMKWRQLGVAALEAR